MDDHNEDNTLSEFNSNIASLQRIDELLRRCGDAAYVGDLGAYFNHLRNLRKEAMYKMLKKHKTERTTCEDLWENLSNRMDVFRQHPQDYNLNRVVLKELDTFEIFLRDFMGAKGMLLKDEKDEASRSLK